MSTYNVIENTVCDVDKLYRKLGKDYIIYKNYMVGKAPDLQDFRDVRNLRRIYDVHECFLEFDKEVILELINKEIHVKL